MSMWRPHDPAVYVFGDIHGFSDRLKLALKRIIPLKRKDKLIFLGDYIDRGPNSREVLEIIIDLKSQYPNQVFPLMGNHEWLMLASLNIVPNNFPPDKISPYSLWILNGAKQTLENYITTIDVTQADPYAILRYIDKSHINFLLSLDKYLEIDNNIFVHAGIDPNLPLSDQDDPTILWDRSLYETAKTVHASGMKMPWTQNIYCGHNSLGPFVTDKYAMIDGSQNNKLVVMEINSGEIYSAFSNRTRLLKEDLNGKVK